MTTKINIIIYRIIIIKFQLPKTSAKTILNDRSMVNIIINDYNIINVS